MKKFFAVLLSLIMIMSVGVLSAGAAAEELELTVASDIHYTPAALILPHNNEDPVYFDAIGNGFMYNLSSAVFDKFLAEAANSSSNAVILSGDLVNSASLLSHSVVAAKLADFEATSGKKVFVIDGNHDISASFTKSDFKSVYADFGYSEAIAVHADSCSYVADLNDSYRLIAIDSCEGNKANDSISSGLTEWIAAQAAAAKEAGKYLIAVMHHNVLEHMPYETKIVGEYIVDSASFKDDLLRWGIKYIFTGHFHINDIAQYVSSSAGTLIDVSTGSLSANSCPYRIVSFKNTGVKITAGNINSIDTSKVAYLYTPEQLQIINNSFSVYSRMFFKTGTKSLIKSKINHGNLSGKLGAEDGSELDALINTIFSYTKDFIEIPLYTAPEGEQTVSSLADAKGITLPASGYKDYLDLLAQYVSAITAGDEKYNSSSTESKVLKAASTTLLTYALADTDSATIKGAVNQLLNKININVPSGIIDIALSGNKDDMINLLSSVLFPIIVDDFGTDDTPADNNATLTNTYVSADNGNTDITGLIGKIINFFKMIINILKNLFKV